MQNKQLSNENENNSTRDLTEVQIINSKVDLLLHVILHVGLNRKQKRRR
jgi:hypothetical protein